MTAAKRWWSHLAAGVMLVGCGSGETPVTPSGTDARPAANEHSTSPAPVVSAEMNSFDCDKHLGSGNYARRCAIRFKLDTAKIGQWTRLGCFGELKYTVVHEGQVLTYRQGFYEGASQAEGEHVRYPAQFDLTSIVYFPESVQALDPSLDWYKCEVRE
jgi:hypothetical protein